MEIALHLELHILGRSDVPGFQFPTEPVAHAAVGQVGDVSDHPSEHQALARNRVGLVIAAVVELRVRLDCLPGDLVEGDVLRRELCGGGDDDRVGDPVGKIDRPLQRLHAAQAAADDRREARDAQDVGEHRLALDPVLDGHGGEPFAVGFAGGGIDAAGPRAAVAAAEVVERNDEEPGRVDRLARADAGVPPSGFGVLGGVVAGGVMVARQGVADEHRVSPVRVEFAVGLVDEVEPRQCLPALQFQRPIETGEARFDQPDRAFGLRQPHHCWHGSTALIA